MERISVIVPVYKTEAYLDRCVQSIVDQTYTNLEIILVDDGSPDNCPQMCDAWAEKDSRIRVIHKENGGGAQARNIGLNAATGEYIGFVDCDDYIHPSMYEILLDALKSYECDISECGYYVTNSHIDFDCEEAKQEPCILGTEEAMLANIQDYICRQLVWNKLYKRCIIGSIRMVERKTIDDEFFTYQIIANARRIAVVENKLYFYWQQSGSIMHQAYSIKRLEAIEAKCKRLELIEERFPKLAFQCSKDLLFSCLYHGQKAKTHLTKSDEKAACIQLKSIIDHLNLQGFEEYGSLSRKERLWIEMAGRSFSFTCRIRNLLGIGR